MRQIRLHQHWKWTYPDGTELYGWFEAYRYDHEGD